MEDFDYTLEIEYERLPVSELHYVLQCLYHCSSECYIDIEYLADEVISRLRECEYRIRELESPQHCQRFVDRILFLVYHSEPKYAVLFTVSLSASKNVKKLNTKLIIYTSRTN